MITIRIQPEDIPAFIRYWQQQIDADTAKARAEYQRHAEMAEAASKQVERYRQIIEGARQKGEAQDVLNMLVGDVTELVECIRAVDLVQHPAPWFPRVNQLVNRIAGRLSVG